MLIRAAAKRGDESVGILIPPEFGVDRRSPSKLENDFEEKICSMSLSLGSWLKKLAIQHGFCDEKHNLIKMFL